MAYEASRSSFFLITMTLFLTACSDGDSPDPDGASAVAPRGPVVAQVSIQGGELSVRQPGALDFHPMAGERLIGRGATLRSGRGMTSLVFAGSVQVELSPGSELIVEGPVRSSLGTEYVLGLQKGEVRINSSADGPLVLKLPHGEVRGFRAFFSASVDLLQSGEFEAIVKAFSKDISVRNPLGVLTLPAWGVVRVGEGEPPKMIKEIPTPGN